MNRISRLLTYALSISLFSGLFSCQNLTSQAMSQTFDGVQTGDLVFVSRPRDDGSGKADLIHVAMTEVVGDSIYIVDATIRHGVDRHPLDTFFCDFLRHNGTLPHFIVKRMPQADAERFIGQAKHYVGHPYDCDFARGTDALYCTELVRDSYVNAQDDTLFAEVAIDFRDADGTLPAYWERLFSSVNAVPPIGRMGTTPASLADSPLLEDEGELLLSRANTFLEERASAK